MRKFWLCARGVKGDARTVTIDVRFDPKAISVRRIASTAKPLEQDASNNGVVRVLFEAEKGK